MRRVAAAVALASALLAIGAAPGTGSSQAGGELRVVAPQDGRVRDPALATPGTFASWFATCATLMAFSDRAGARGYELRPEAAAGAPQISRDRRTYVFTVRKSLRFSDRVPITAENFEYALRRVLDPAMHAPAAQLYGDISGMSSSGRRLTIRLRAPSGDLPMRLAMPWACPVPLDMPVDPAGVDLTVGSGPYYVTQHIPNKVRVFARNPYYGGRRPHHVDRIEVSFGGTIEDDIRAVEEGEADLLGPRDIPRELRDPLAQRYGLDKNQFFRIRGVYTFALVLNTSRPLFRDNVPLRKAVNLALDRREIVRVARASSLWFTPTDQIVPRWIPGWTDYRIYPLNRPDLARAQKLAAGHLHDGKAVMYVSNALTVYVDQANVIAHSLDAIGLHVTVVPMASEVIEAKAAIPGEPYDMILDRFTPDYPDPANMLVRLLAGENASKPAGNTNFAYFDDRTYDRRLATASRLAGPARFRTFSRLDAEIMRKQAAWAPLHEGMYIELVSKRVGCLKLHPVFTDWAAMCVR